jgi:hypothetical protein
MCLVLGDRDVTSAAVLENNHARAIALRLKDGDVRIDRLGLGQDVNLFVVHRPTFQLGLLNRPLAGTSRFKSIWNSRSTPRDDDLPAAGAKPQGRRLPAAPQRPFRTGRCRRRCCRRHPAPGRPPPTASRRRNLWIWARRRARRRAGRRRRLDAFPRQTIAG